MSSIAIRILGRDARASTSCEERKIAQVDTIEVEEEETWIEGAIRKRSMAEERETTRLSVLKDWNELKSRVNIY